MIQMKSGVYGGKKLIRPADGPFSLTPEEEARLVNRGVAKYVGGDAAQVAPEMPELPDGVTAIPAYSEDMKPSELREIGKMCGLTFQVGMSKAAMVTALDAYIEKHTVDGVTVDENGEIKTDDADVSENVTDEDDDDSNVDDPPAFDPAQAVQ